MSNRDIERIDFYDLHSRLDQLENKIAHLPSKTFIVAVTLANVIFIALLLLFQARLLSFVNTVLPGL